ncbi:Serine/threonine-protein kinase PrkC [Caulifigura coniformis]|uniref:Serine/threonine-protein kinase PrkC n=1 Tax=Caulifigura coniformis TaxID=2527983 RepID=A0A517SLL3_9PLAN|nr:FHA domain-containing serine/threonine-protein kinase [Caulifigura coniformis]QDT57008.1 Serine/threonine-protein kinase PrkC [Caulifigura coniformis]
MNKELQSSVQSEQALDEVCRDFEDAFKARKPVLIEEVLVRAPSDHRNGLLGDLLDIELWWRRVRGDTFSIDDYRQRFPQSRPIVDLAFSKFPTGPAVALDVIEGPHTGEAFEFSQHCSFVVGRAADVQFSLSQDQHLSRHHCRLEMNPPMARIIDLDSRNGTFVNNARIKDSPLTNGDVIRFGNSCIRVRVRLPPAKPAVDPAETLPAGEGGAQDSSRDSKADIPLEVPLVPGYELLDEIGEGGLGVVYAARQLATNRKVAIKFIRPDHAVDLEATRMFLREASVLSQLQHPRIVQFVELGSIQNRLFLVMEHLETITFDEVCRDVTPQRRWQVACGIVCRVLEALEFAHQAGYVHRDVKPANILLFRQQKKMGVKLADFGLAKSFQTAGLSGLTQDDVTRGSLAYMPPEQVVDCRSARPPSDLYATGATLFNFLTGRLPYVFTAQASALRMILEEAPIRADSLIPDLPAGLADLISKAMAKSPSQRFRSAEEMRETLYPYTSKGQRESL